MPGLFGRSLAELSVNLRAAGGGGRQRIFLQRGVLLGQCRSVRSTLISWWNSLTGYPDICPEVIVPALNECPNSTPNDDLLGWDGFLWGTPKKKTSHSKKRMRSAHKYLKPKTNMVVCKICNNLKLMHTLCGHCLKLTLKATAEMRKQMHGMVNMESNKLNKFHQSSSQSKSPKDDDNIFH